MYAADTTITNRSADISTMPTSRRRQYVQTTATTSTAAVAAALLAVLFLVGAAGAASTGAKPAATAQDLLAVGSESLATAAAAASMAAPPPPASVAEPAAAESKKLAGHAALMDGYALTGSHKGDKGYNEDDVFGDKVGDSYGFGTHAAYGSNSGGDGGASGAYHESSSYDDNGRSNPKYSSWHFEDKDGKPTKRYVYDSHKNKNKHDPQAVEAEASEYDSVEAYDYPDDGGSHAGYETEEPEPEYGALYDSADVYDGDY